MPKDRNCLSLSCMKTSLPHSHSVSAVFVGTASHPGSWHHSPLLAASPDTQQRFLWAVAQGQGSRVWQLTYFSLSPNHLDIRSEEDTEKKVELLASVATALAR